MKGKDSGTAGNSVLPNEGRAAIAAVTTLIFLLFAILTAALVLLVPPEPRNNAKRTEGNDPGAGTKPTTAVPATATLPKRIGSRPRQPPERAKSKGNLVIIIDDVGNNSYQLDPFLALPFPITLAVMPDLPHSEEAARKIVEAGKELILHQPMEALGTLDPGPQAIYHTMKPDEIAEILAANIRKYPGIRGMNNHMGSLATQYPEVMRTVLETTEKYGIYFVDSLTITNSTVHTVALELGINSWERDVFLDNTQDKADFEKYIAEGVSISANKGTAIMIGHVWSTQLAQTLMDLYPHLVEEGYSLTTISKIMMEESVESPGD